MAPEPMGDVARLEIGPETAWGIEMHDGCQYVPRAASRDRTRWIA